MKKMILLLGFTLLCVAGSYADDNVWADINFTRDSVLWGQGTTPPQPNNQSYSDRVFGDYTINGFFGRFNATMRKLNSENLEEQFIMSWRLSKNVANQLVFPEYDNIGNFKMHFLNTSNTDGAKLSLQYRSGFDENDKPVWSDFDPVISISVDPSDGSTSSVVIDTALNISDPIQIRIAPLKDVAGNYFLQVFAVSISKYVADDDDDDDEDPISALTYTSNQFQFHLNQSNLFVDSKNIAFVAHVYNVAGVQVGSFTNNQTFKFDAAGQYIVKLETAQGTVVKKLAVF